MREDAERIKAVGDALVKEGLAEAQASAEKINLGKEKQAEAVQTEREADAVDIDGMEPLAGAKWLARKKQQKKKK